ncbi:MAG: T9SS type A sorting domain-containing protein [Bacteroidales bacterium]|jgi:hypothetical protein|nr:T9SS type A sorting domain-containing protein [Bacteroidales bacterium]
MKKICLLVVLLTGQLMPTHGQKPVTRTLEQNPALANKRISIKSVSDPDTVDIPFIDDFWYYQQSSYPKPSLWTNKYVYINNHFPDKPRSNGVATFDALDDNGQIYNSAGDSFFADTLTSCPIRLQAGMTGVYLSFFYQPQGFGDAPEANDKLILQFKSADQNWQEIWQVAGTPSHPFKQVLIPLEDAYLYNGFQFRLINSVSFGTDKFNEGKKSNVDVWHLDYVRLDKNRTETDTAALDVAVIAPLNSLIKGYTALPWSHFKRVYANRLDPQITVTYRNNDNTGYLVKRVFECTDLYYHRTWSIGTTGSENIQGGEIISYREEVLNPFETPSADSAFFELKAYLVTDDRDRKENDTVRAYQEFKNYFARDDGAPESGYGYEGINAQGFSIACHYEMFIPDTLQAVAIYFNPVLNDVTRRYVFKIAVWKDDNGLPGEQIYLSQEEYSPLETGRFTVYPLERKVFISKNYWIGWQQVTSGFLNVGFDLNNNDRGNLWYNSSGTWLPDENYGTLMIRPFSGKMMNLPTAAPVPAEIRSELKVYPNPASQYVRVEITDSELPAGGYELEIYNSAGQLRFRRPFTGEIIDISPLEQGLYVIRLVHRKTGQTWKQRLVIIR